MAPFELPRYVYETQSPLPPPILSLRDRPVLTYPIPTLTITACAYDDGNDISDLFLLLRPLSLHYGRRRWRKRRRCPLLRLPPPQAAKWVCAGGRGCLLGGRDPAFKNHQIPKTAEEAKEREGRRRRYHLWPVFSNRPREEMHYCGTNRRYSFVGKEGKTDNEALSIQTTR